MRLVLLGAAAALALPAAASAQEALRGAALVIGQSAYEDGSGLRPLRNPENDARGLDGLLDDLGFHVERELDAKGAELRQAVDSFAEDAAGADVAIVYYSGHGIEVAGESYLIPVDADMSTPESAGASLVSIQDLLAELQRTVKLTILLFDACRTNSMPEGQLVLVPGTTEVVAISPEGLGPDAVATRGEVLAVAGPVTETMGSVIGFAASPDRPAEDGRGDNSPFAAALLKHLGAGERYDLQQVMTLVTQEVYVETAARQLPWTHASLLRFVSFGSPDRSIDPDETIIENGRRRLLLAVADEPPEVRGLVEAIAAKRGVELDSLYGILAALDVEISANPEALETQLNEASVQLEELLTEREAINSPDPEIARLRELSQRALDQGLQVEAIDFLERAQARFAEIEPNLRATAENLRERFREGAAAYAESARIHEAGLDWAAAAADWEQAYLTVEDWDDELAFDYRLNQADALDDYGLNGGHEAPIYQAMEIVDEMLAGASLDDRPQRWMRLQRARAGFLINLGTWAGDSDLLQQSVDVLEELAGVMSPDVDAPGWALVQHSLGGSLRQLGLRQATNETLEAAVLAFEQALTVRTRESNPQGWASSKMGLANTLADLGFAKRDTGLQEQAIAAYEEALDAIDRASTPLLWARMQQNLGATLYELGARTNRPEPLDEALRALKLALEERRRDRVPRQWATTVLNIAITHQELHDHEGDGTVNLEAAIAGYQDALTVTTPANDPLQWARIMDNLGGSLRQLGVLRSDPRLLAAAETALMASLTERHRDRDPIRWAFSQNRLGLVLVDRWRLEHSSTRTLDRAISAYRSALEVRTRELMPIDWADTQGSLGLAYLEYYTATSDHAYQLLAAEAFRVSLAGYGHSLSSSSALSAHERLSQTLIDYGLDTGELARVEEGLAVIRERIRLLATVNNTEAMTRAQEELLRAGERYGATIFERWLEGAAHVDNLAGLLSTSTHDPVFNRLNAARLMLAEGVEANHPGEVQEAVELLRALPDVSGIAWIGTLRPENCAARTALARLDPSTEAWMVAYAACSDEAAFEEVVSRPSVDRHREEARVALVALDIGPRSLDEIAADADIHIDKVRFDDALIDLQGAATIARLLNDPRAERHEERLRAWSFELWENEGSGRYGTLKQNVAVNDDNNIEHGMLVQDLSMIRLLIGEGVETGDTSKVREAVKLLSAWPSVPDDAWIGTLIPERCSARSALARLDPSAEAWTEAFNACSETADYWEVVPRPSVERHLKEAQAALEDLGVDIALANFESDLATYLAAADEAEMTGDSEALRAAREKVHALAFERWDTVGSAAYAMLVETILLPASSDPNDEVVDRLNRARLLMADGVETANVAKVRGAGEVFATLDETTVYWVGSFTAERCAARTAQAELEPTVKSWSDAFTACSENREYEEVVPRPSVQAHLEEARSALVALGVEP